MSEWIPYGRQVVDEDDVEAVVKTLRSSFLTTGPKVGEFEAAVAKNCDVRHGVAVSNGTAALHCCMSALGVGPGDEVIVPPITFAATANCAVFQGATPVFADVDSDTLLIDPVSVESKITSRTKVVIGVDYAGQPCDWNALREIASTHGLWLVDDACHALGAQYGGKAIGTHADMTVFSFHPVKHIATGEGGMVVTDDEELANKVRSFRSHGIQSDSHQREKTGAWFYEMVDIGYNYRLTDIQCALGLSQLGKLDRFLESRREIARRYDAAFSSSGVTPLAVKGDRTHAYHLYAVKVDDRERVFMQMHENGIGVNVHYIPVHLHPYYRETYGTKPGMCPHAEAAYEKLLSLPVFPTLERNQQQYVIDKLLGFVAG